MITRRSQMAWLIASARWAKPDMNSSAPLNGERGLWREPWKGRVNITMSQPSAKNWRRPKNDVFIAAEEAPKPWMVMSVARGPSWWRQCWARATAFWVPPANRPARSGCRGANGLWKRSSSTRPPMSSSPVPGWEWTGIGVGGGLNTLAGSWAEANVA
jgi:hypothetical protein